MAFGEARTGSGFRGIKSTGQITLQVHRVVKQAANVATQDAPWLADGLELRQYP
ncbi:MAG TPA: hypothetical protein VL992_08555 [Tepidisphaeraceae bacterium]|nr:hypothetical protein [Tepidisphaeraceae bacterium]